jgi:uncharacterized protein with NRDE domain
MCTVVFFPNNGKYCFASLRDESPLRQAALKPAIYTSNHTKFIAPLDAKAGGTWVGANEFGNVIVLLNGGFENHTRQASYIKSRGLIVKELIASKAPVSDWLLMNLDNIEPFTLVVLSENQLYQLVWDGRIKHSVSLDVKQPYIWSSATLYDTAAKAKRNRLFKEWVSLQPKISEQSILSFFQSVNDANNGFLINRSVTMQTLSYTFINIAEAAQFNYHDFLNATESTTTLALKQLVEAPYL